jgi:very-short-patch-repair endonuclease
VTPAERKMQKPVFSEKTGFCSPIVDFFCAKSKLVIEVDGDTHAEQVEYDEERTRWLHEQKQYRVIRFTNDEVTRNLDAVAEAIRAALESERVSAPRERDASLRSE